MKSRTIGTIVFTIILTFWWIDGPLDTALAIGGWKGAVHACITSTVLLGMAFRIHLGGLYLIDNDEEGDDDA